ncbi:MAG: winged helix-turn-helix domain-containing protein [Chloroflexi bacterium]|nr:winged helix-turn-helix domain-containing protein [Chloroflexota bacterium]
MTDDTYYTNGALERSLRSERDRLQQTIEQLRQEIELKEADYRANEERLVHVQALLSAESPENSKQLQRERRSPSPSTPTPELLDLVEQVLREREGEPMHYRDLADELMRRGAVIRGQDPASALVSRMTQDDNRRDEEDRRFIRPTSKGFYALREDYPNARNVGARRRRTKQENDQ